MLLACLAVSPLAHADPIHAIGDGAYWHHASHWVFAEKAGAYVRVGFPQDVAGSEDAEAHYAYVENGVRHVAKIDVYRASSEAAGQLEAVPGGQLATEGAFLVSEANALYGIRRVYRTEGSETPVLTGLYLIAAGEWRITIRISGSTTEAMDAFVHGQRWESLTAH